MNSSETFLLLPTMLHLIIYIFSYFIVFSFIYLRFSIIFVNYVLENLLSSLYALSILYLVIVSNLAFTYSVLFCILSIILCKHLC